MNIGGLVGALFITAMGVFFLSAGLGADGHTDFGIIVMPLFGLLLTGGGIYGFFGTLKEGLDAPPKVADPKSDAEKDGWI